MNNEKVDEMNNIIAISFYVKIGEKIEFERNSFTSLNWFFFFSLPKEKNSRGKMFKIYELGFRPIRNVISQQKQYFIQMQKKLKHFIICKT